MVTEDLQPPHLVLHATANAARTVGRVRAKDNPHIGSTGSAAELHPSLLCCGNMLSGCSFA